MEKLIIENRSGLSMTEALQRCLPIVDGGRISGAEGRKQYCYHSVFNDGVAVSAFLNAKSDRLVLWDRP